MVKCQDKAYPDCYHQKLYCPESCLRTCRVGCASCQPVCSATPTPTFSPPPPEGGETESPPSPGSGDNNHSSPPLPKTPSLSPPPPEGAETESPPSPESGDNNQSPPPPKTPSLSRPPPSPTTYPSPPPPPSSTLSTTGTPPPPAPSSGDNVSPPPHIATPSGGSTPTPTTPSTPTPTPTPTPSVGSTSTPTTPSTLTPSHSGGSTQPNVPPIPTTGTPPPPAPSSGDNVSPPPPISTPTPTPSGGSKPPNVPSTPIITPPPSPPSGGVSEERRVRCKSRYYPACYGVETTCPSSCPQTCEMDCATCKPVCSCDRPGAVCQDPRFIGGDGITFYFHGKKDRQFCLVTDLNVHINAHFIGHRNVGMGRDFTWVQSLGILFGSHRLYVGALKTSSWDDAADRLSVFLDGSPVIVPQYEGTKWRSDTITHATFTRYRDTNAIENEVEGIFKIKAVVVPITKKESLIHNYGITNEDCFAHLDLSFKFKALSGDASGVLGQTYARNYVSRAKMGAAMPVLGGEREFASSGQFATDCEASRFVGRLTSGNSTESFEFADLECAGGIDGRGVVCKR